MYSKPTKEEKIWWTTQDFIETLTELFPKSMSIQEIYKPSQNGGKPPQRLKNSLLSAQPLTKLSWSAPDLVHFKITVIGMFKSSYMENLSRGLKTIQKNQLEIV